MFNFFKKNDQDIERDVLIELGWLPSVDAKHVTVSVREGIATLRGNVPHYFEKRSAVIAAQGVGGVRAVADEMEVNLLGSDQRNDADIAQAALNALEWNYSVPEGVKVSVENGWVTLTGHAEWDYERLSATAAVAPLMGVRGVSNEMDIDTKVRAIDVKSLIEAALKRSAKNESRNIGVAVLGDKVTLSGNVHSLSEMQDAKDAAWGAPGVNFVENNLHIAA